MRLHLISFYEERCIAMTNANDLDLAMRFDTYIKKCLKRKASNFNREKRRQEAREILFSDLSDYEVDKLQSIPQDDMFACHFQILHHTIHIQSPQLATALSALTEEKRNIILLYYFVGYQDWEISQILNLSKSAVSKSRIRTLKSIKKHMEEQSDETKTLP